MVSRLFPPDTSEREIMVLTSSFRQPWPERAFLVMVWWKGNQELKSMPHSQDRYKAFAEAYLTPGSDTFYNITQSAVAAGYTWKYVNTYGKRLLGTVGITKALEDKQAELLKNGDKNGKIAGPEDMLEILTRLMYFNPKSLLTKAGKLKTLKDMDKETAFCLTSIEQDKSGGLKYKWNDKVQVIKTIFDSLGLKNGNKELVDRVIDRVFNLNVQVNVGAAETQAALKLLVGEASNLTKGKLPNEPT